MDEYENLDLIGNARSDSVIYDLAPQRTGKKGRPASHGKRLSIQDDFTLSDEKIGNYLRMAGKIPVKPDREWPYAVHPFDAVCFSMANRS